MFLGRYFCEPNSETLTSMLVGFNPKASEGLGRRHTAPGVGGDDSHEPAVGAPQTQNIFFKSWSRKNLFLSFYS